MPEEPVQPLYQVWEDQEHILEQSNNNGNG